MNNNQEKPVKLDGFALPSGTGAAGSSSSAAPLSASASASAPTGAAISAGGGAGAEIIAAKKPAASGSSKPAPVKKKTKKAPKKNVGASAASSVENDSNNLSEETALRPLSDVGSKFEPLSLPQIQLRIKLLLEKLPANLPECLPNYNPKTTVEAASALYAPVKTFASAVQILIEEYNLLLSLVSSATYRWGVDRSGASQQNLSVMSAELQQCQEVISTVVSARLSNVLCPAVDVMIGEVEIVKGEGNDSIDEGDFSAEVPAKKRKLNEDRLSVPTKNTNNERRINHYTRPLVDPSYVHLCHCILARNGTLVRHSVATSIHTAQRVIGDYLNAMKKDSGHEDSKGGYY